MGPWVRFTALRTLFQPLFVPKQAQKGCFGVFLGLRGPLPPPECFQGPPQGLGMQTVHATALKCPPSPPGAPFEAILGRFGAP